MINEIMLGMNPQIWFIIQATINISDFGMLLKYA